MYVFRSSSSLNFKANPIMVFTHNWHNSETIMIIGVKMTFIRRNYRYRQIKPICFLLLHNFFKYQCILINSKDIVYKENYMSIEMQYIIKFPNQKILFINTVQISRSTSNLLNRMFYHYPINNSQFFLCKKAYYRTILI